MKNIMKIWSSMKFAARGLVHAYTKDKSFPMEVNFGIPVYVFLGWFLFPFTPLELILFLGSYLLILIVELVNTAVEMTLDHLHPTQHEKVGMAKDVGSAAVFLAFVFAALVVSALFYVRVTAEVPVYSFTPMFV